MKVGFFIKGQEELFSNGCNQQALFVYQTFMEIEDMECLFFTYKTKTNNFLGIPTYDIKEDENLLLSLDILIFLSNSFSEKGLIKKLKLADVSLVDYNCGNILYILKEDIIFGKHNYITENLIEKMRNNDQYWVIPNYSKDIHFYKSLCRDDAKVHTAPYVWNTDILNIYTKNNDISWSINKNSKEKYIIIAEPNMQITKNCLIPLLICNDLYKVDQNIKVMVLCKPETKAFEIFCKNLKICQDNKVEYYPRIQFYEVLRQLKEKHYDVFILSHHKDNPLNFLHLETLYLNYPLIHNCERYTNAGYYYKTIQQASLKLREAMVVHANNINNYKTETQKVLYTFSPKNPTNQFIYKRYLDEIMENKTTKIINKNIKINIEKKQKFKLVVIPTHGFGNRIKMLASSYIYADFIGVDMEVIWKPEKEMFNCICNIELNDIFKLNQFQETSLDVIKSDKYLYFGKVHTNTLFDKIDKINKENDERYKYVLLEGGHEFKHPRMSLSEFINKKYNFYKSLKFKDCYKQDLHNQQYIAIHYRAYNKLQDNQDEAHFEKSSPFESFIDWIKDNIDVSEKIMVISNNNEIKEKFKNKLNDWEFINNDVIVDDSDRNNKEGMIKSIQDFINLANSKLIIGSKGSSFSDEATFINYIPKIMPTNVINTEQQGYHSYNVKTLKNCLILNFSNKFNEIIKKKNIVN